MKRLLALLVGLLIVGATAGIAGATNITKIQEVKVYTLYVEGKPVKIVEKGGVITVGETPRLDRKKVFEAVNSYFIRRHKLEGKYKISPATWYNSGSDYRERKVFSISGEGDVYIAAYAYCDIEGDYFFVTDAGGYSSAYSWLEPYDYWWTQGYDADRLTLSITLKFVGIGISLTIPPGIGFTGSSSTASFSETAYHTDYLGHDYSGIEASSTGGIWRVEDHTYGSFYFSHTSTTYTQGAHVYIVRGA